MKPARRPLPLRALFTLAVISTACSAIRAPACEAPAVVGVFDAADIGEQWIDYVWLEVPAAASPGTHPGRLFVASADPPGAIVPTMIDLPCLNAPVDYAPALVGLEFDLQGNFKTSYGWKSCATCSECYMHWTFSLDAEGHVQGKVLHVALVLNETFHSDPMNLVILDMGEVTQACREPHMQCESARACGEIRFGGQQ